MFLAINELMKEKAKFLLIVLVIMLVSYLTFFLTGLAYGLATSYTQGIDKWHASGIVLQNDVNSNIARSLLTSNDYKTLVSDDVALLGVGSTTVTADKSKDIALFGIDMAGFLAPNITEGRSVQSDTEVVVSDELARIGVQLDQKLLLKGDTTEYTVVGFTDRATFQTAPIVYMNLSAWRAAASQIAGMTGMRNNTTVSALVMRGSFDTNTLTGTKLEWQTIKDYSFTLPGYNAQVLTFSTMIGFLIVIASFVLAIFMYILTLQKRSIFGVLKAEGIPNGYIARSVLVQTVILCGVGLAVGLGLTLVSAAALAGKVPFLVQPLFFVGIALSFLVFALVGGLASVRAVTKIDPVEAIG